MSTNCLSLSRTKLHILDLKFDKLSVPLYTDLTLLQNKNHVSHYHYFVEHGKGRLLLLVTNSCKP